MQAWGMRPSMRFTQAHGTVCQDILHRIGLGAIVVKGNVAQIHEDGVTFDDGTRVELDAIVFCTGYRIRFSFLPKSLQPVDDDNNVRLYKVRKLAFDQRLKLYETVSLHEVIWNNWNNFSVQNLQRAVFWFFLTSTPPPPPPASLVCKGVTSLLMK